VSAAGGSNKFAEFFIDLSATSPSIDSIGTCPMDSSFVSAIVVHGAKKLGEYQFYIVYDTMHLRFVSAVKGNVENPNFLESNGGSLIFLAKRAIDDSTKIFIGGSIMDADSSRCVDGNGIVALITFQKRTSDRTTLSLAQPIVEDSNHVIDTGCLTHGANVFTNLNSVRYARNVPKNNNRINFYHRMVKVDIPSGARNRRAFVVDVFGRKMRELSGKPTTLETDLSTMAHGEYLVVFSNGNETSIRKIGN
jgi:hypothetical protein